MNNIMKKTAREWLDIVSPFKVTNQQFAIAELEVDIKEYARQVAEQALKDANQRLNEECKDFGGLQPELSEIILSTPIVTP